MNFPDALPADIEELLNENSDENEGICADIAHDEVKSMAQDDRHINM